MAGLLTLTSIEQLFLIGAIAIAVGVFTYSKRVMVTVGAGILPMSPVAAWVVVIAHSIVLFLFASQGLEHMLAKAGLPTIPLVPVSSSQAVVGAVVGLGLMRGGRDIDWKLLRNIAGGWITTPLISGLVCFVALFFLQNVFDQQVHKPVRYELSPRVAVRLGERDVPKAAYADLIGRSYDSSGALLEAMQEGTVSQDREIRVLPAPFTVFATQNPIELEGTYPLPEAQLDRFIFNVVLDYLSAEEEVAVIERNTLELELPERRIVLDESGIVRSIAPVDRLDSHRLIEEFMITANVAAARELVRLRQPAMFRIHDEPNREKLEELRQVVAEFGVVLR